MMQLHCKLSSLILYKLCYYTNHVQAVWTPKIADEWRLYVSISMNDIKNEHLCAYQRDKYTSEIDMIMSVKKTIPWN